MTSRNQGLREAEEREPGNEVGNLSQNTYALYRSATIVAAF